ncbi:MAG: nuclear transport factor 2 family protein [bacterium]|nr:nuclear transport factor 2 family protein [bacterium]
MPLQEDRTPLWCAQEQLEAYNSRDIERFANVYADDVELIDLATHTIFCKGLDALRDRYGALFASRPDLHCTLTQRMNCPPFVIDEELVTGHTDSTIHAIAIYEVADGYIQRAWFVKERA